MSQNITWLGASYSDVPFITLPKTGGGSAQFTDVTDTTAAAADVSSDKYFYTANGTRTQGTYTGSQPNLQAKTNISPTTSSQTITADNGYDGLSSVQINAMPSMTLPTAASGTSSGSRKATIASSTSTQYINIPTGYNSSAAYYQLSAPTAMTLPTSASSTSSGTSKATISRSTSNQYINIPTGYNSSAAYYTVSAVADGTAGTPSASKSISGQTATITPSVTNTTGYITGGTKTGTAVTVTASELVTFVTYYTSSSNPSSSQGSNGDIWLVTS